MSVLKKCGGMPGRRQKGISLIELIMFIVIVGVGIAGVLSVMNMSVRHSVDPMQRKQAIAIAEALLEEVSLMPFTDCDPDAFVPGAACTQNEGLGPEGETRGDPANPFDNVNDYDGFSLGPGDAELGGSALVAVPAGFDAQVDIDDDPTFGQGAFALGAGEALRIRVTVSYNGGADAVIVEGYRTRYAPEGMP